MGAREVMRRVRDGYRLERPAHCHPDLYLIIQVDRLFTSFLTLNLFLSPFFLLFIFIV